MKPKHFAILGAVLAALLVARLLVRQSKTELATDLEQAGVGHVLSAPVEPAAVTWVEITGPQPKPASEGEAPAEPPATLRFERDGSAWVATGAQDAPADKEKLDEFVKSVVAMAGEQRAKGEGSVEVYGLEPTAATRVVIGQGEKEQIATVLVGKAGDAPSASFVRQEGGPVYHVRESVRSLLGLFGEGGAPAKDLWLEKRLVNVESKDVARMTIDRGDSTLVIERAPAAPADPAATPETPAPPATWTVSSGDALPWSVQDAAIDGIVSRAGQARAGELLADPAPCAAMPVGSVTYELVAGGQKRLALHGAVPGKDEWAVTLDGSPLCWSLPSWAATSAVPRATALYQVPVAFPDAPTGDPSSVRVQASGLQVSATRKSDGTWTLSGTKSGAGNADRLSRIATTLRSLRLDDVAFASKLTPEQLAPVATISAVIDGKTLQVKLLGDRPGGAGERYARIDGGTTLPSNLVAVLSKQTVTALLPDVSELAPAS